jgi:hypothetical protein
VYHDVCTTMCVPRCVYGLHVKSNGLAWGSPVCVQCVDGMRREGNGVCAT